MTKEIVLTRGYVALVDDEDYEWLSRHSWYAMSGTYPYAVRKSRDGKHSAILMHRVILGLLDQPYNVYADHVNGDVLDNRRANLRICNNALNQANTGPRPRRGRPKSSRYKGVCLYKGSWRAAITLGKKRRAIGSYATEEVAAKAYDAVARDAWGEFAYLNFPDSSKATP